MNRNMFDDAKKEILSSTNNFIGIEKFITGFWKQLKMFSSLLFSKDTPKGILLYGPPGSGKTYITQGILELLPVTLIGEPLTGSDLK